MARDNDLLSSNDILSIPLADGYTYSDFNSENKIDHGFWINDLYFEVPPERISSQEENAYAEFQAIRSNSSWKIPTGVSSEIITISLSIPHKNAIINIDSRDIDVYGDNTGKRGGVLDLILQFKHIPFSCIENAYLRSKLKIPPTHNMVFCMHNLALSTTPGEPNVLVGTLTISLMAYTPYSDKWLFKKDWVSNNDLWFEDVNDVNLAGRIPYKYSKKLGLRNMDFSAGYLLPMSENSEILARLANSPGGKAFLTFGLGDDPFYTVNSKVLAAGAAGANYPNSVVNPMFQTVESLNNIDLNYMRPFEVTRHARESEPFKVYMDWIHRQSERKVINNETLNYIYDMTRISPYGSENHDLGGYVLLKWKEFKNIQIDPLVADKIRLHIKRKIALYRYDLFKNKRSALANIQAFEEDVDLYEGREPADGGGGGGPNNPTPPGGQNLNMPNTGGADEEHLHPVFCARINRWYEEVTAKGYKIELRSGYRSTEHQTKLYEAKRAQTPPGQKVKGVARPGMSAHEYGLAIDMYANGPDVSINTLSVALDRAENKYPADGSWNALLEKYGLWQALRYELGYDFSEAWHIEPIETKGKTRGATTLAPLTSTLADTIVPGGIDPAVAQKMAEDKAAAAAKVFDNERTAWYRKRRGIKADGSGGSVFADANRGVDFDNLVIGGATATSKILSDTGEWITLTRGFAKGTPEYEKLYSDTYRTDIHYKLRDPDPNYIPLPGGPIIEKPKPPPPVGAYINPAANEFTEGLIKERVGKLPRSITNGEIKAFAKYNAQVKAMKDDGWEMYDRDLTSFDMFFKNHELIITSDGGVLEASKVSPIVCDFISATAFNLFKKIPMQGLIVPTAQFLGRQDNSYILSFKGNGLNSIKKLEIIKDTLKKQGIMYKYIPESYVLRVENNFINAFGDVYFVINGLESSTLPEQPGTYAMEMRLTGHDLYIKEQRINRVSTISNIETTEAFLDELLLNSKTDGVHFGSVENAAGVAMIRFYDPGGLSNGHTSFLSEIAATINLCNKLIPPDDYEFAAKGYKFQIPEKKKIFKYFGNYLYPTLGKSEPYIYLRQFENTAAFRYPPQGSPLWREFTLDAPDGLKYIAKPIWDFVLESEHVEYDLSDSPLRSSAFSTSDGANVLPYAKALTAWGGQNETMMYPYIAAHRNLMAVARNTLLFWYANIVLSGSTLKVATDALLGPGEFYDSQGLGKSIINSIIGLRLHSDVSNPFAEGHVGGEALKTSINKGNPLKVQDFVSGNYVATQLIRRSTQDLNFVAAAYADTEYKFFADLAGKNKRNYADVNWQLVDYGTTNAPNGWRISLIDNGFMDYVYNYLIIPYLNNVLRYSDIYLLVMETPYFPKTRALIIGKEQEAIGPAYEDLLLPFHPYWNENKNNIARGASFTEPDFYLANPGTDSFAEENATRRIETNKANLTPEQAYNYYVQLCAEYATGDIDGLQGVKIPLNPEYQLGKTERPGEKQINSVQFDHHRTYTGPKTIVRQKDSNPEDMMISPQSQQVEWKDVKLLFGDNIDLIAPLNANVDDENKLLNNRLLNWSYQDYDLFGGQDAIIKVREGYDNINGTNPGSGSKTINPKMPVFQFHDGYNSGNGDSSPYMNFSNTRYPILTKLKDAIGSINRKKLAARRAFPTVKIYFIEEDDIYNKEYIELDEVYSYSQVESVEITESRKRAASICKITFLDPHGILSGFNQFSKAADPIMMSTQMQGASPGQGALDTEVTSPFLRDTKYEQSDISFRLNVGLKIKVCLGFSNDANKLQEVFLGEISDVGLDGSGNRVDVIATGYGAELVAKTKGINEAEAKVVYNDTFDLLAHMMFEPEIIHFGKKKFNSVTMFGEDQSIKANSIQYKETFAIGGMINASKPGGFPGYSWLSGFGTSELKTELGDSFDRLFSDAAKIIAIEPYEGPQDDNLFAPNYLPIEGYYFIDYFKRWSGKISQDGSTRIVKNNASGVEEIDAVDVALVLGIPTAAVLGLGTGFWAASAAGSWMLGLASFGLLCTVGVYVIAAGLGVLAAYITFVAATTVFAAAGAAYESIKSWWTGDDKLAKLDNAKLIQIVDPDALKYNIFYSTIWDIFEEMTLRHPGYVKHPRIYYKSNRMTMFFGLPDQNMWESAGDPLDKFWANKIFRELADSSEKQYRKTYGVGEALMNGRRDIRDVRYQSSLNRSSATENRTDQIFGYDKNTISGVEMNEAGQGGKVYVDSKKLGEFLKYARRRFKPFRKWHNVNSYTDIISNDIEATADGWYTEVQVQYTTTPIWGADSDAEDAAEDVKPGDTTPGNANALIDWDSDKVVTKQANVDLSPQYVRSTSYQFVNAKSIGLAKTYARALLAKQAKEMYKGSLTIMGNPYIRPYDVIMLSDTYNNMYGPIEVEEVNHIFSPETGYVTVIYPDTFLIQEDTTPYVIMNGINHDVHTKTEYYMENSLAAFPKWGDLENYSSQGRAYMADMSKVINAYRRSVEEQELDIEKINDLFFGRSRSRGDNGVVGEGNLAAVPTAAVITGVAVGIGATKMALTGLGFTVGEVIATGAIAGTITTGGALGTLAGATIATGGLALGAVAIGALAAGMFYFYASSRISQMILNYIADSRAFMMIPLVREGQPMIAGINFGYASGMHKSPMQYIRQYWMDGGMGRSLQESDMLMRHASIANRNGGRVDSFLASTELGIQKFQFNFDNVFHDFGDYFFQDVLFPEGNTDVAPGAAAQVVDTLGKAVLP